ncbi:MAG: TIGR04283 family arsenosugar biosynthesis glycosyltransferase [Rhodobacteraceae bacterium]|nr:TIGR04283 family arsenosugar biosynthesis glycosyltransferase [Paracoccaceae bacterium]
MPAPISIVIPTLNAEDELAASLEALMEGLASGLIRELVISDGGSTDRTLDIAEEAGARIITGAASRGGQLRRGCADVRGEWLLVLHADTRLSPGWSEAVSAHLEQSPGRAAWFHLSFRQGGGAGRLVAAWANLRAGLFGLPYGDQGLLVPRALYQSVGGYPDQRLMEDVALVRKLRPMVALQATASTSPIRYQREGWLRRGTRNLLTLTRYFLGADPDRLAGFYTRR